MQAREQNPCGLEVLLSSQGYVRAIEEFESIDGGCCLLAFRRELFDLFLCVILSSENSDEEVGV